MHTSQRLWGVSAVFGRCQSGVPLQVRLSSGSGPTLCPSPLPGSVPRQVSCAVRQQVAGPTEHRCSLAGDVGGGPACFLPTQGFPQLLAGQAMLGRKAGLREAANTATCSRSRGLVSTASCCLPPQQPQQQ